MYILDKNKDYYDYLSHIYGVDKSITYDRRGSIVVSDEQVLGLCVGRRRYRENEAYVVLEVGYTQYIFKFSDIQYRMDPWSSLETPYKSNSGILHVFKDNKHYFDKEITLCACVIQRSNFSWRLWENR